MAALEQANFQIQQELGGIEMVEATFHRHNFSKHSHENYTINVIETGCQRFSSSKKNYIAPQHSIIFVNADEVHTGQSATDDSWSYRGIAPFESQFSRLATDIGFNQGFAPHFPKAVVEDKQMANELRALFTTLATNTNALQRETMLYGVLTRLMLKYGVKKRCDKLQQTTAIKIQWVQEYINDHLAENITLETLAKLCDFSPFYLIKQFQKQFGQPPHAYQIQQRLQRAKHLLKQDINVANVAADIGFYDQSHFHRHFKKANGITPSRYAQQVKTT